jgi:Kef-type K+ transport system membrane component KefB
LRDLFKTIFISVGAISVITFGLVTGIVRALLSSNVGSFVDKNEVSSQCMVGISMLIASIMTARSPASAIAIAKELRAKGPFTRSFLGITVVSDVVVLVLFAISAAFTRGQCTGEGFNGGMHVCVRGGERE